MKRPQLEWRLDWETDLPSALLVGMLERLLQALPGRPDDGILELCERTEAMSKPSGNIHEEESDTNRTDREKFMLQSIVKKRIIKKGENRNFRSN